MLLIASDTFTACLLGTVQQMNASIGCTTGSEWFAGS